MFIPARLLGRMASVSWMKNVLGVALVIGAQAIGLATAAADGSGQAEFSLEELRGQFAQPPAKTKIMQIIHNWPNSHEQQDATRKKLLQDRGFGGIVSNVSFDQYMESEEHWAAFQRAIEVAKKEGANLWLYDEKGYPSGNAGGLVLRKNPDWEAEGLLTMSRYCSQTQTLELTLPPGKLLYARAIAFKDGEPDLLGAVELSDCIQGEQFKGEIPAGHTLIIITRDRLYEGTHADGNLHQKIPYINLLSKEATYEFARLTYENYAERMGNDLGKWFEATFTDEPSLMSVFLKPMPYGCLPWEESFAEGFEERNGYDLLPLLPLLVLDCGAHGEAARVKYDFWKTVGDKVAENYFGQIQDFCARYNIPSGGHLISEESLATHIPFYGNFFGCLRRMDAPSMDCLTSQPGEVPWYVSRLVSSAAQLNANRLVMSETSDHSQVWRPEGDERPRVIVSVDEIRGTLGRQIVGGVNRFTSYYSWSQRSDEEITELNQWCGRSILLTEGGRQVTDIAVFYPVESCWARYLPSRLWANDAPEVLGISGSYHAVGESLWRGARDFTYIDSQAVTDSVVGNMGLEHPCGLSWRLIVLPSTDTLPLEVWNQLEWFVERGGLLIAAGSLPQNSSFEYPSQRVRDISSRLFGEAPLPFKARFNRAGGAAVYLPQGMESMVSAVADALLERDFTPSQKDSPLRVTHRSFPDRELYYVFNDSKQPCEEEVSFAAIGNARMWDPQSGEITELDYAPSYKVRLEGWSAVAFTFERQIQRKQKTDMKELPQYEVAPLALGKPGAGAGEFVRFTLTEAENGVSAQATLTKSDVDTYLFLNYVKEMDLSGAELMSFEVKIPDSQRTPTQLLVVLRDADAGEYLAHTGYTLGGRDQNQFRKIYVPISSFLLAGWSKDPNARLDLDQIRELRIGWGGYYGQEGETVEFSVQNISILK